MDAVILAGGRGKRLKPLTDYIPKPLVCINDIPIIQWQIQYLKKHGIKKIIICTGYKTRQIENFLKIKDFGIDIIISKESKPLGTGGAIKKISRLIKSKSFFVINGDIITDIDIKKLIPLENSIAAIPLETKFGIITTQNEKIMTFSEKKITSLWMNAGIYHLNKKVLSELPKIGDIEKTLFPKYAKNQKLSHVKFKKIMWHSIDSFKDIEECSKDISSARLV